MKISSFFCLISVGISGALLAPPMNAQTYPYQNPSLSHQERAKDLLSRLTLDEKALLMCDESEAIPRLGIKKFFWWSEALHGAANMGNVTVFPEPIAMASSFNDALLYKVFDAASTEMRAQYNKRMLNGGVDEKFHSLSVWTPNVNIFRDPRWGRGQETYGEDPYLTSRMGISVVRGLQGPEDTKYRKLWACAKHYAVHSGPEYTRHSANLTDVSPRDFWETYMPAFKATVQDANVREVMCAYQRLDDDPCCGSNRLLQQILRDEWDFKYLVVSDCGAVSDFYTSHKSSTDATHASAKAVLAGTDVECGFGYAYKSIPEAVRRGFLTEAEVDKHVLRLLEGRFDLGEMDDPSLVPWSKIPASKLNCKEHQQIALDMARQSVVLLQNNGILPLSKKKIAVIGPNADNETMMWGNYNGTPNQTVTILEGIQQKVGKKNVKYFAGCDLTNDQTLDSWFDQCSFEGKRGMKATFWNNRTREGKPVSSIQITHPVNVTTYGAHNFGPGVNIVDFSAKYETTLKAKETCDILLAMTGCSDFELYVDGKQLQRHHTWRTTETRTVIPVEKGKEYKIEILYADVQTWNANLKFDLGRETPIDYQNAIKQLKGYDEVVFVGGISPALEGEEMPVQIKGFKGGDRTDIELPSVQRNFLKALHEAGKRVVYVNCSGSAIALQPESAVCDAIVQAWYAGEQGGTAIAEILYGDVNPSAKLPVTFYKSSSQLPDFEDYSMKGRTYRYFNDALFPFGYGLSYTTFDISAPTVNGNQVICKVTNTGRREGTEIVQLYLKNMADAEGPSKSLRGFQRIALKAGESKTVTFSLKDKDFEWFDVQTNTVRPLGGEWCVMVGNSSNDKDLKRVTVKR